MSFLKRLKTKTPEQKAKKAPEEKKTEEIKVKEEEWFETEGELAVDVYQTKDSVVIEAPVAGVKVEDLDIGIEDDAIKIKGKRERVQKTEQKNYLLQECYWGLFSREIISPVEINGSKAEAIMEQGILVIKIPKIKRVNKKKIKVKEK